MCCLPLTYAVLLLLNANDLQCEIHGLQNNVMGFSLFFQTATPETVEHFGWPYLQLASILAGYKHKSVPQFQCRPKSIRSDSILQHRNWTIWNFLNSVRVYNPFPYAWNQQTHYNPRLHKSFPYLMRKKIWQFCMSILKRGNTNSVHWYFLEKL